MVYMLENKDSVNTIKDNGMVIALESTDFGVF